MATETVVVNGEATALGGAVTLGALLQRLGVSREGVAVALNDAVVPKARLDEQPIRPGDRIEVIRAVAGG